MYNTSLLHVHILLVMQNIFVVLHVWLFAAELLLGVGNNAHDAVQEFIVGNVFLEDLCPGTALRKIKQYILPGDPVIFQNITNRIPPPLEK